MKQSHSILIFLSKGYFFSANCKKEVAATLANGNPVMLLHETDPNRGGTSMEQMLEDCPEEWREDIFVPRRPVIPWHRVKEFKIVSLKMIVSSMLLHQSKVERQLQSMDEDIHAIPTESDEARVRRTGKRAFAPACRRLASDSNHSRSSAAINNIVVTCEPTESVHTENSYANTGESAVYAAQKWLTGAEGAAASSPSCSPSTQLAAPAASPAEDSEGAAASAERVQEDGLDSAFSDCRCELPSSVGGSIGGSVATAACSGAALSNSSQRNLARSGGSCGTRWTAKPVHRGSAGKAPDLHTLGTDLYVPGEVTRQQLSFPPVVLIISADNPGARLLREVCCSSRPASHLAQPGDNPSLLSWLDS